MNTEQKSEPAQKPTQRNFKPLIFLAIVLLAISAFFFVKAQIQASYLGQVENAEKVEDWDGAIQAVEKALSWDPRSPELLLKRCELKIKKQDYDSALIDVAKVIEMAPSAAVPYLRRGDILQRQGKFKDAISDFDSYVQRISDAIVGNNPQHLEEFARALNGRAYARALADTEIDEGLADIQKAFQILGQETDAAFLDTRGYLYFKKGEFEKARHDLTKSVEILSKNLEKRQKELDEELHKRGSPTPEETAQDEQLTALKKGLDEGKKNAAVIYHHRGEVLAALGHVDAAEADFETARSYGYKPGDY